MTLTRNTLATSKLPGEQHIGCSTNSHGAISSILPACRFTCENVMRVLRSNKDSVMAMLEAFVHDPLINWRLLNTTDAADPAFASEAAGKYGVVVCSML